MSPKKKPAAGLNILRQKAETALTTTRAQVKKMVPEEVQHLVHELQVHQIELEMQNEELRQTQLKLEVARDRYATLYDFTPVGYATLDGKWRILEANLTLCQLLGVPRSRVLKKKLEEFVDPEDQPAFHLHLDTLKKKTGTHSSDVLTLWHPKNFHRVRLKSCLETMEPPGLESLFRIWVVDVTERERIAAAQEEQKALLELVVGGVTDAIVTTDEDQRIVLFNEGAENMFRCPVSSAIGQPIDRFIPERFRVAHQMHHRQFGQNAEASRQMGFAREIVGLRTDGEEFPIEATISQVEVKGKGKKLFTVVLRDITERHQALEALMKEQQFVTNVLDTAGALVVILDPQWRIVRINRGCEQTVRHSFEDLKGQPFWNLWVISGEDDQGARLIMESYKAGRLPAVFESALVNKARQLSWIQWTTTAIYAETGEVEYFIVTGTDITARKQAEQDLLVTHQQLEGQQQELRSLAAQLLTAQEEERRRISRDLHDDVNQRLALLSLKLQTARNGLPDSHLVTPMIQELYESVANLSDDIRHLAYQYHPSILDDLGLGTALRSLCEDFAKWEGVSVTWEMTDEAGTFSQAVATCLYRVAQESLRNVSRHAQASAVHLLLREDGQGTILSIHDNGQGFEMDGFLPGGLGFVSMRERVRLVDGTLLVDSQPGHGTTVRVSIPGNAQS